MLRCRSVVYRRPYQMIFPMPRPYPWMKVADALGRMMLGRQPESLEKEWSVKTDAQGRALITFDSSDDLSTDMSYRVEVRVSDASRREVVAQKEVRVSRQGHFANIVGDHRVIEPFRRRCSTFIFRIFRSDPFLVKGRSRSCASDGVKSGFPPKVWKSSVRVWLRMRASGRISLRNPNAPTSVPGNSRNVVMRARW